MKCQVVLMVAVACLGTSHVAADDQMLDLSGHWSFQMDPEDCGITDRWFERALDHTLLLPGSMQAQGFGASPTLDTKWTGSIRPEVLQMPRYAPYREAGNFKMPFWLQPKHYYVGPAWYQRSVTIGPQWKGRRITLHLERCHWLTNVWVDGQEAGQGESLSVPHLFDLTERLTPGEHRITIRIDNRLVIDVGENSHSVTDHTQTNWNGVVGRVELRTGPPVWIDDVQVFPNVSDRSARIQVTLLNRTDRNSTGAPARGTLHVKAFHKDESPQIAQEEIVLEAEQLVVNTTLSFGADAKLWDEHHPNLYTVQVQLTGDSQDALQTTFGMREVATEGTRFLVNGQPVFLRGTLECCIFPLTGYPPTDVAAWKKIIERCKEFGLNHIRFHSWCPPEAAFTAADALGFYFQIECASWANGSASVGNGTSLDDWLYREADRILRAYGNHPSFLLLAYGNEPSGPGPSNLGENYLAKWVAHYKQHAPRQLVTCASGWPLLDESDYHVMHAPLRQHRLFDQQAPETTKDYRQQVARYTVPLISHETGQWCVFPNLDEMQLYSGVLEAKNFEIVHDFLSQHGLLDQAPDFLMASGQLQKLLYKEEIEVMLRTPGFGGFQLLDLHDFPGQGTALIGVLDPFWNPKPYVTAKEFQRFSGAIVPLARMAGRVWTSDQTLSAAVDVSQFGDRDLMGATVEWSLRNDADQTIGEGRWTDVDLPRGGLHKVGTLECSLAAMRRAGRLTLSVSIPGTSYANDWQVWVYPPRTEGATQPEILVTRSLDEAAEAQLKSGGKVLLLPMLSAIAGDTFGSFEPIFWNRLWFPTQQVQSLGLLCNPQHAALAEFPTDSHSNWQWWDLCNHSKPMILDDLPGELAPIVQTIDDWNTCRKLGLIFEAQVEQGKLLVCAIDLVKDLEQRPVARQLRHSLLQYMAGPHFAPATCVPSASLQRLFRQPTWLQQQEAAARATSQQSGYESANALDGNPDTIWHTAWGEGSPAHPHEFVLDLQASHEIRGLAYLPRQDMTNGRIAKYEIYASQDGRAWGPALARGEWPDTTERQTANFERPLRARYIKLVALSEVRGSSFASAAEIDVLR
ncbi:MAG: discoidin domain-containing protein [Pirellulaceae bacterium]